MVFLGPNGTLKPCCLDSFHYSLFDLLSFTFLSQQPNPQINSCQAETEKNFRNFFACLALDSGILVLLEGGFVIVGYKVVFGKLRKGSYETIRI
jgi:hypothetical protein